MLESGLLTSLRNEVVLIKGARAFHFDEISDRLEQKVHETILEINLNALVDNLNYYRNKLKPETKMVCMVKASAYGAGSFEIAKTLEGHRVDYLAVAVADEGADLRKAGINSSIMIMNPELTAFKTMFDYKLEPEVYSFHLLDELIKAAGREGASSIPIHIKIDTGMHRLGFAPSDIPQLIDRLQRQTAVIPRSIFSHLVGSDSATFDSFTRRQIETSVISATRQVLNAIREHSLRWSVWVSVCMGWIRLPTRCSVMSVPSAQPSCRFMMCRPKIRWDTAAKVIWTGIRGLQPCLSDMRTV